jgi:uroporphyrinogen-III synthase
VRQLFASGAFNTDTTPITNNDNDNDTQEVNGSNARSKKYGGMIFTSQRAVEAFAKMIEDNGRMSHPTLDTTIDYSTLYLPSNS